MPKTLSGSPLQGGGAPEQTFLAISIPTYNRAPMLEELLAQFADELRMDPSLVDRAAFYILDNASSDATADVVANFKQRVPRTTYIRQPKNLGIRANVLAAYRQGDARYRWVIGDDEVLHAGGLSRLVAALERDDPGLAIVFPSGYALGFEPDRFDDVKAFVLRAIVSNIHALGEHTLCSCNVVRTDCYDVEWAEKNIEMFYGQMFGAMRPLHQQGAAVLVPAFPVIALRGGGNSDRSDPADGRWADVDACWAHYLSWLRDELALPELDPHGPSRQAKTDLWRAVRRAPLAFLARHRRSLFSLSAYRFGLRRLMGRWR